MLSSCSLSGEYVRRVSHDYVTYSVFTSFSIHDAIPISLGHIALAVIPGVTGLGIGLVLIAIGSGGVKTTAQVVLGSLYTKDDPRRDGGFSIFYMGINIGGLLGQLITTASWGWKGFH